MPRGGRRRGAARGREHRASLPRADGGQGHRDHWPRARPSRAPLVRLTDFDVTVYDAATQQIRAPGCATTASPRSTLTRSAAGARRPAAQVDGRRHPQHDGLPGDPQVKNHETASRSSSSSAWLPAAPAADRGLDPALLDEAARRCLADLPRRLLGPPLQHAEPDQHHERQEPVAGLDLSRQHVGRRGASSAAKGPETPPAGQPAASAASTIKSTPLLVNGVLYFTAPDHVWAVDAAHRPRALALLLADQGRHPHRQPRRRACTATGSTS